MPLYLLSRPGMASGLGLVVRASDEHRARIIATNHFMAFPTESVRRHAKEWMDEKETPCVLLMPTGAEGVVTREGIGVHLGEGQVDDREARLWAARNGLAGRQEGTRGTP